MSSCRELRRLENAKKTLTSAAVTLGAGLAAFQSSIVDRLELLDTMPQDTRPFATGTISFFVVLCLVLLLIRVGSTLLDWSPRVRRFFLGCDFVEGCWVDIVYDQRRARTVGGGLLNIFLQHGELVVKGETFNRDATSGGQFLSNISEYKDHEKTVCFVYSINLDRENVSRMDGFGEYSFQTDGRAAPRVFWGHFYVHGLECRYDVYAEKLSREETLRIAAADLQGRGEFVAEFIAKTERLIVPQPWRAQPGAAPAPAAAGWMARMAGALLGPRRRRDDPR